MLFRSILIIPAIISLGIGIYVLYYLRENKSELTSRKYKILLSTGIGLTFVVPGILIFYSLVRSETEREVMCYRTIAGNFSRSVSPALFSLRKKSGEKFKGLLKEN